MDQRKLNEIMQRIQAISGGELNIKVHLYEQLLPYTLGCFGFYDNAMEFLKEAEKGPEGSSAQSSVSMFSAAPNSAAGGRGSSLATAGGGGSSLTTGFAPNLMPSIPSMGGYALGAGPGVRGYRPLVKPLNLSGLKKGRRNTRRRR